MPLDPFFEERLRVHRKHLIDKARGAMRARLTALWPFGRIAPTSAAPTGNIAVSGIQAFERLPVVAFRSAETAMHRVD